LESSIALFSPYLYCRNEDVHGEKGRVDHAEYHGVGRRFLQFPHGGTLCALQSWWLQMDEQITHMG